MPRFIDISGTPPITAAADVRAAIGMTGEDGRQAINADFYVNALDYGVVGDDSTDDTAALQSWVEAVVAAQGRGFLPTGTYKITDTITVPSGYGWEIHGENKNYTTIKQYTDNTPILQLGTTAGASSHSYVLDNLHLQFANAQPATNTSGNCITFEGPNTGDTSVAYNCRYTRLQFTNAYYGFKYKSGVFGPWGCRFDDFWMGTMSGGLLENTGATGGCPNNVWGRMSLNCSGAAGPIFNQWRGTNLAVEALEFLNADQGPNLITTSSGFTASIQSMKLELATYTAAQALFNFTGNFNVNIDDIKITGSTAVFTPPSSWVSIVQVGSGGISTGSHLDIGLIEASATSLSGGCYAVSGGGKNGRVSVGVVELANGWALQNVSGTTTGNFIEVRSWVNGALSDGQGDADLTVAVGDPNVIHFNTTFTAQRTITLPAKLGNNLCSGLYYDLIFDGAINGANTAVIKEGSNTLRTQSTDGKRLRYMWRRAAWVLVDVADLTLT